MNKAEKSELLNSKSESEQEWSALTELADQYNSRERGEELAIEEQDIENSADIESTNNEKNKQLSRFRRIGRFVLGTLGVRPYHSNRAFSQKATSVIENDPYSGQGQSQNVWIPETDNQSKELMRGAQEDGSEQPTLQPRGKDEYQMQKELIAGMDSYRMEKTRRFQQQRIQESVEKEFNRKLLTIDALEEHVAMGDPGVAKRYEEYDGKRIPIYDLKGIPFCMFNHDIEYRSTGGKGSETSKRILEDPSFWTLKEDAAMKEVGYVANPEHVDTGLDAMGNTICISYINSEHNINTRVSSSSIGGVTKSHVCYGFSHVDGSRILKITNSDGNNRITSNKDEIQLGSPDVINWLEGKDGNTRFLGYNEILSLRYSENGDPVLPDYIIATDGIITEDMKKHAAFFEIPIVNIDSGVYIEKMNQRASALLDSVNGESSYEEIESVRKTIASMWLFNEEAYKRFESSGNMPGGESQLNRKLRLIKNNPNEKFRNTYEKIVRLKELEFKKRLDLISEELSQTGNAYAEAWREKREYQPSSNSIKLKVKYKKASGLVQDEYGDHVTPASPCATLEIETIMPDGEKIVTNLIDGRKYNDGKDGGDGNGDSRDFDRIFPGAYSYLYNARQYYQSRVSGH